MDLKLTNQLSKVEYTLTGLTDLQTSRLYYMFDITLPEGMLDGQYSYQLIDDDNKVVATGILQVGDYVPEVTVHNTEKKGYIVYGE